MASYHIGSFSAGTVDAFNNLFFVNAGQNPNGNKIACIEDSNFASWGASKTAVQLVFVPGTGKYVTVIPNTSTGPALYCGFSSLADLLANAQFTPDGNGGAIGGGTFATVNDVAAHIASGYAGCVIDATGTPINA